MFQLKFNDNFDNLIRDITYWNSQDDISENIKRFIIDTSNMRVVYEKNTNKFYCGKCLGELDTNNYCKKCDIKHKEYTLDDVKNDCIDIIKTDKIMSSKIRDLDNTCNYFVFDIVDKEVFLYHIEEKITYYNPLSLVPYKSSNINIDSSYSYYIERDGITNLKTNNFIYFKDLDTYIDSLSNENNYIENPKMFGIYEEMELVTHTGYLYKNNLVELKNTIYKYSRLWELNDFLEEKQRFNISQLTLHPLYYKSFEYLINYKLYNLAWNVPNWFKNGKNFEEIFGVNKNYLSFMQENDISPNEFEILQHYPTNDIDLLRFFSNYSWGILSLKEDTNIDLKKLKKCLEKNNLSSHNISEYADYVGMAKELKLDLKDKKILYPNNLQEAHDELYNQIEVVNDPIINEKIKSLSSVLSLNRYEDENYVIYPASSIEDLVDESRQQKNCVRTYCEMVSKNKSQIYFMRKKTELEKSLVTIEVRDRKIIQARVKYNKLPSDELNEILNKWEQTLIPITNN